MADRRYGSTAWKRLRKQVLLRDGGLCQVRGPRCIGVASAVDHIYPASTHPELFWDPDNLRSACKPCNSGRVSGVQADRVAGLEATVDRLQTMLEHQEATIERLAAKLAGYENGLPSEARRASPDPHIY